MGCIALKIFINATVENYDFTKTEDIKAGIENTLQQLPINIQNILVLKTCGGECVAGSCKTPIVKMCVEGDKAEVLSNTGLADALENTVWVDLNMTSQESALIGSAIDRLRR